MTEKVNSFCFRFEFYRSQVRVVMVLKVKVQGLIWHRKLYSYSCCLQPFFFFVCLFHKPLKENLNNHLAALSITAHSEHICCKHQQIYIKSTSKDAVSFFIAFCEYQTNILIIIHQKQKKNKNQCLSHYHMNSFSKFSFYVPHKDKTHTGLESI